MEKVLRKLTSVFLVLVMLCGLLTVPAFAETESNGAVITINSIKGNVVNIYASSAESATVVLASHNGEQVIDVKYLETTLVAGTNDYTVLNFEAGSFDDVTAFVWKSLINAKPLCDSLTVSPDAITGSVTVNNGKLEENVVIETSGNVTATVPQDVKLEDNVTELTLSVTPKSESEGESNITINETDDVLTLDVHIEGISEENNIPITVDLGEVLQTGMNATSIRLYHVENGETIQMTYVANNEEFTAHNQFKYDPATGRLVLYLATFSDILTVTDTINAWIPGTVDTSWYTKDTTASSFTISNAEQLAGLGEIVAGTETAEPYDFENKTIILTDDIDMGGNVYGENGKLQFYPIGYTKDGCQGEFSGTFDGAGHKISNIRQNTWDMIGTYEGTYYNAAMGLFGYVVNATIKNLTVDNFSCESEFGVAGVIAAYADGICNFENIALTNCSPYTYNNNCAGILATDDGDAGNEFNFKNITIDNTNTIGALWGTWDGVCAGIMCSLKSGTKVDMTNCHVAAKLDVYNDVCGNYQYYWYRYSGMLIGRVRDTVNWNGYDCPDLKNVTATNCTVNFGDWNNYYYCEIVANTQASYTHDHQMSRLVEVKSVDGNVVTHLDGSIETITDSNPDADGNYRHFVVVPDRSKPEENVECYHFKDGVVWNHEDAGYETKDIDGDGEIDSDVLKEDKQHIYLPFNQLFTGTGWGIRGIDMDDLGINGIIVEGLDIEEGEEESVVKFKSKVEENSSIYTEIEYTIGTFFEANPETTGENGIPIASESVIVSITAVDTNEVVGTYIANPEDWTKGTIKFKSGFEGAVKLTIQDYQFCKPTEITLNVTDDMFGGLFGVKLANSGATNFFEMIDFNDFIAIE